MPRSAASRRALATKAQVATAVRRSFETLQPVGLLVGVHPGSREGGGWVFAHGTTRLGEESLPAPDTVWQIGSVTKTFTATLLAEACHCGVMALHDPVQRYAPPGVSLPTYDTWNQSTAIRFVDLATHTAGLPMDPRGVPARGGYTAPQMYRYLDLYALAVQPATSWNYSNLGFGLLANLLMERSGLATYQEMVDRLKRYGELSLPATTVSPNIRQKKRRAWGYAKSGETIRRARWDTPTWPAFDGSGALYSTLDDILTWLAYNLGELSSPLNDLLGMLQTVYYDQGQHRMGLAWEMYDFAPGSAYWSKGGNTSGFTSFVGFSRDLGASVAVLSNSLWYWGQDLAEEILRTLAE